MPHRLKTRNGSEVSYLAPQRADQHLQAQIAELVEKTQELTDLLNKGIAATSNAALIQISNQVISSGQTLYSGSIAGGSVLGEIDSTKTDAVHEWLSQTSRINSHVYQPSLSTVSDDHDSQDPPPTLSLRTLPTSSQNHSMWTLMTSSSSRRSRSRSPQVMRRSTSAITKRPATPWRRHSIWCLNFPSGNRAFAILRRSFLSWPCVLSISKIPRQPKLRLWALLRPKSQPLTMMLGASRSVKQVICLLKLAPGWESSIKPESTAKALFKAVGGY
jgi:hypothetical protein